MKILFILSLIISYSSNAGDDYIEFGTTNLGNWNYEQTGTVFINPGLQPFNPSYNTNFSDSPLFGSSIEISQTFSTFEGVGALADYTTNRDRKFLSFKKGLGEDFYTLGAYRKSKSSTTHFSFCTHCDSEIKENFYSLGFGYEHSLKNFNLYAELSKYKATTSTRTLSIGWLLGPSEPVNIANVPLTKYGNTYTLGLRKKLTDGIDIDIGFGSVGNLGLDNIMHRNKSIKLIKELDDEVSLVLNYEKDELTSNNIVSFNRTNRSLSLRSKF